MKPVRHSPPGTQNAYVEFATGKKLIFMRLNYLALSVSLAYPVYLVSIGTTSVSNSPLSLFTSFLPAAVCLLVCVFIHLDKIRIGIQVSYFALPVAIAIKAFHEPLPGLMLYPLVHGIICFFCLREKSMVIAAYTIAFLSFSGISIYYSYVQHEHFYQELPLLIFSNISIAFLFYIVMNYLRKMLIRSQTELKRAKEDLASKNLILETQQEALHYKQRLLMEKNQQLYEINAVQGRITAVLTHDVRTTATSMKNVFDLHKEGKVSNDELIRIMPEFGAEIDKMNTLFNDIIEWIKECHIKNAASERNNIPLHSVIRDVCNIYSFTAKQKNTELFNYCDEDLQVFGNIHHIRTIFRNLLSNAIKFTKNGSIQIDAISKGSMVEIMVTDTGTGIKENDLRRIQSHLSFSTAGTDNEQGSGLGLSFCRDFILASGGELNVESVYGRGTSFRFTLPAAKIIKPPLYARA